MFIKSWSLAQPRGRPGLTRPRLQLHNSTCIFPLLFSRKPNPPAPLYENPNLTMEEGEPPEQTLRRRPVPGKGHPKSRRGCLACKKRRVKCTEELPTCRACRRLALDCEYIRRPPISLPSSNEVARPLGAAPPLPSEDLRFFHHFLTTAYPALLLGSRDVWHHAAALSHEVPPPPPLTHTSVKMT